MNSVMMLVYIIIFTLIICTGLFPGIIGALIDKGKVVIAFISAFLLALLLHIVRIRFIQYLPASLVWAIPYELIIQFIIYKSFVLIFKRKTSFEYLFFPSVAESSGMQFQDKIYGFIVIAFGTPPLLMYVDFARSVS
jgi:hypothetical protein